jgi:hypothetical protein
MMKIWVSLGLAGALLVVGPAARAQDANAPAAGHDKAAVTQSVPTPRQMDEQVGRMQTLHDRMASARTAEERRKLMQEERQAMQQCMGMMEPMMHGSGMAAGTPATEPGAQMQMMQKRLDMMQMMMQMMMDQQGASAKGAGSDAAHKH